MSVKYTRRSPQSWADILEALTIASTTNKATPELPKNPLTAIHKPKLDLDNPASFLSRLTKENADVEAALGSQGPITKEVQRLADSVRMFCAHFHQVLDFGILRGTFPSGAGARSYYARDIAPCPIPVMESYEDLEKVYKKIVSGEAARLAAEGQGSKPMAMPSANEVGSVGDEFHDARVQSLLAQRKTNDEREELQQLWDEALALVLDIWDTVEFFFRHDPDPSSFRAKCAEWGVRYIYIQDDKPDPTSPTPPNP